jgi:Ulp1 family protease
VTAQDSFRYRPDEPDIKVVLATIKSMMAYDIIHNPMSHRFDIREYQFSQDFTMPRQDNPNDCGVFTCQAARYISAHKPLTFSQNDMPYFRQHMQYELLSRNLLTLN